MKKWCTTFQVDQALENRDGILCFYKQAVHGPLFRILTEERQIRPTEIKKRVDSIVIQDGLFLLQLFFLDGEPILEATLTPNLECNEMNIDLCKLS